MRRFFNRGFIALLAPCLLALSSCQTSRIVYPDLVAGIYDPDELSTPVEAPKPVVQVLEEAPKVEQLPVVRDGEFIGFVTRDTILHTLHEGATPTSREEESHS